MLQNCHFFCRSLVSGSRVNGTRDFWFLVFVYANTRNIFHHRCRRGSAALMMYVLTKIVNILHTCSTNGFRMRYFRIYTERAIICLVISQIRVSCPLCFARFKFAAIFERCTRWEQNYEGAWNERIDKLEKLDKSIFVHRIFSKSNVDRQAETRWSFHRRGVINNPKPTASCNVRHACVCRARARNSSPREICLIIHTTSSWKTSAEWETERMIYSRAGYLCQAILGKLRDAGFFEILNVAIPVKDLAASLFAHSTSRYNRTIYL